MNRSYIVSTDKSKLDIQLIHDYLNNVSYWAKGRSIPTIRKSIENSLCFGVYVDSKQVGFGRIVTDYSVFAWIMDVFIIDDYKGRGIGKQLMDSMMSHSELRNLQRWGLATSDAHGLYEKYGFGLIKNPGKFMEIVFSPS